MYQKLYLLRYPEVHIKKISIITAGINLYFYISLNIHLIRKKYKTFMYIFLKSEHMKFSFE